MKLPLKRPADFEQEESQGHSQQFALTGDTILGFFFYSPLESLKDIIIHSLTTSHLKITYFFL